jgi:hypothetical protein
MALKNMQALMLALLAMMLMASSEAAITCRQVGSTLAPASRTRPAGGRPWPWGATTGVRGLNSVARTTADRQAACRCLKSLAGTISKINMGVSLLNKISLVSTGKSSLISTRVTDII